MKNLKRRIAGALLTLPFGLALAAQPADAADRRPCVSTPEAKVHHHGDTRHFVEDTWEVVNRGGAGVMATILDPGFNTYIIDYQRCGFDETRGGVSVFYREDNDRVRFVMTWRRTDTGTTRSRSPGRAVD